MKKNGNIVRYTKEELDEMIARGEDKTNWAAIDATTDEDIQAQIAADPDDIRNPDEWSEWHVGLPPLPAPKRDIHIRLDGDVLDWFKASGRGYQTRINHVLRAYVHSQRKAG